MKISRLMSGIAAVSCALLALSGGGADGFLEIFKENVQ